MAPSERPYRYFAANPQTGAEERGACARSAERNRRARARREDGYVVVTWDVLRLPLDTDARQTAGRA